MTYFRNDIAAKCGVNAAVVAQLLWDRLIDDAGTGEALEQMFCPYDDGRITVSEYPYGKRCRRSA